MFPKLFIIRINIRLKLSPEIIHLESAPDLDSEPEHGARGTRHAPETNKKHVKLRQKKYKKTNVNNVKGNPPSGYEFIITNVSL